MFFASTILIALNIVFYMLKTSCIFCFTFACNCILYIYILHIFLYYYYVTIYYFIIIYIIIYYTLKLINRERNQSNKELHKCWIQQSFTYCKKMRIGWKWKWMNEITIQNAQTKDRSAIHFDWSYKTTRKDSEKIRKKICEPQEITQHKNIKQRH